MSSPPTSRTWTTSRCRFLIADPTIDSRSRRSDLHPQSGARSFRLAPFVVNSPAPLGFRYAPFPSLRLETSLHSQGIPFYSFPYAQCRRCSGRSRSTIGITYPGSGVRTVGMTTLPLVTLVWTSEDSVVAADGDCQSYVFSGNECGWRLVGILDNTSRFSPLDPGG